MANLKLNTKLSQSLVMTPQLQQAIKILQMPVAELEEYVQEELLQNPVLEEQAKKPKSLDEIEQKIEKNSQEERLDNYLKGSKAGLKDNIYKYSGSNSNGLENLVGIEKDLKDHLLWQARFLELSTEEKAFAELLIYDINDDGYLPTSLEKLLEQYARVFPSYHGKINLDLAEDILSKIQEFDPPGIASRTVEECLARQVFELGIENDLLLEIINKHLSDLNNLEKLAKTLKEPLEKIKAVSDIIKSLEPKPGRTYTPIESTYIVPDVYVYKYGDDFVIVLNEDNIPQLRLSEHYLEIADNLDNVEKDAKNFISEKIREAYSLIKSISHRQTTLKKVTEVIVNRQKEFFEKGVVALKPLILKDIAKEISMHESTVSRVTSNKFIYTSHGIFELKYFLNNNVSSSSGGFDLASEAIKYIIKELIIKEDPENPLSDLQISYILKEKNLDVARRTISKYRESMNIPSSTKRKKEELGS